MEDIQRDIVLIVGGYRENWGHQEKNLLEFKQLIIEVENLPDTADKGEMIANITLAYRHLEDARMRMGKVIQAHEGGISIYDKKDDTK